MFYTNVQTLGNNVLYRGVDENGKRVKERVEYSPSLFVPSSRVTGFTTLEGDYLEQKLFPDMKRARDFVKQFDGVSNAPKIYGQNRFEYAFIAENFKDHIEHDIDKIIIAMIDIEVGSDNGFPEPERAEEPITAICLKYVNGPTLVFGCGIYETEGNEIYVKCRDEYTLCKKFLEAWTKRYPDIISGWNIKFFDIPYLYNRFVKILGEQEAKKLSPWGFISQRKVLYNNKEAMTYGLVGVATIDYLELYRWYAPNGQTQENYKLNTIGNVELGIEKISYDEYDSLHDLYKYNFQKFIRYNIRDTDIVLLLDAKLGLLSMIITLAYDTRSNYEDVFAQTRMWDNLIYSYLLNKNIIVPPREQKDKDSAFEGAYVKEVLMGLHKCVASFDLDSLYSHLMMQYNISPETLIDPKDYTDVMRRILSEGVSVEKLLDKKVNTDGLVNATLTPNGQFFRTDVRGFLAEMLDDMYANRKKFKKLMLKYKQNLENETDPVECKELEKLVSKNNNIQLAKKESLVSAYGVLGSKYFRFYDLRQALAVTQTGKLSIKWIEKKINEYMNGVLGTNTDYVIASDTDSIYLNLEPLVNKVGGNMSTEKMIDFMDKVCSQKIQPFIIKSYKELAEYVHAYDQKMSMKRESLCDKGIWTGKKHYILSVWDDEGVRYKEPKIKVKGLEMVKSSTPTLIRKKMEEIIAVILKGTEYDVQKFINDFREEFNKASPEDVSFPRGINGIKKYSDAATMYSKGTPIHVRGAIIYNHMIKEFSLEKRYPLIVEGDKIKFTYLKLPNPTKENIISYPDRLPKEFKLDKFVDFETQFDKTFVEPIQSILTCMGWSTEKKSTLFD
jgi:DNA polymerase elongation subunit (family B)